jgi:hypothetical protein
LLALYDRSGSARLTPRGDPDLSPLARLGGSQGAVVKAKAA